MAFDATTIASTFATLVNASPNKTTFTFGAKTDCTGVKTVLKKEVVYGFAGYENEYDFSLICAISQFTTVPDVNNEITISSTVYRIVGTEKDSCDTTIRLDLSARYGDG